MKSKETGTFLMHPHSRTMNEPETQPQSTRAEELTISLRRSEVVKLYHRQHLTTYQIAEILHVDRSTICRDLDAIEEAALTEMEKEGRKMVLSLDRQFNAVIAEAWAAYEKSKEPAVESTSQRGNGDKGDRSSVKLVRKNQTGDPRYLAAVIAAGEKLAKLHRLGGFASEASIQMPVAAGAQVVIYMPENGRPVRVHKSSTPPAPSPAPRVMEAQTTTVSSTPAPTHAAGA